MIKVFYGDDRGKAMAAAERFLGEKEYEVIEGEELSAGDFLNIFQGGTLFQSGERRIMLRDAIGSPGGVEIAKYVGTGNRVAILELKPDKRTEAWKKLVAAGVETTEFKIFEADTRAMFDIFRIAKRDGSRAVAELRRLEPGLEPKAFVGVLASQAFKDLAGGGEREKKIVRELAKLDMDIGAVLVSEASAERPWLLIESFLVRMGRI